MSTRINVSIDRGGLLQRNSQQTAANRQATLDLQQQEKIQEKAVEQRQFRLQQESVSNPTRLNLVRDEPAANRIISSRLKLGHLWIFTDEVISETGLGATSNAQGYVSDGLSVSANPQATVYIGTGNGANWTQLTQGVSGEELPSISNVQPICTYPANRVYANSQVVTATFVNNLSSTTRWRDLAYYALPAGEENFIVLFCRQYTTRKTTDTSYYRLAPNPTQNGITTYTNTGSLCNNSTLPNLGIVSIQSASTYKKEITAFVCNQSQIRQIELPSTMEAIAETLLFPDAIANTTTVRATRSLDGFFYLSNYYYTRTSYNLRTSYLNTSLGNPLPSSLQGNAVVFDPVIFQSINQEYPFVSSDQIKVPTAKINFPIANIKDGGYRHFTSSGSVLATLSQPFLQNLYNQESVFKYASMKQKGVYSNLASWSTSSSLYPPLQTPRFTTALSMEPSRTVRQGTVDYGNYFGYAKENLVVVWDWADPSYCKTMCKALGFSDTDLSP